MNSFVGQMIAEIMSRGALTLHSHQDCAKDYISVLTVVAVIKQRFFYAGDDECAGVYNVCNGFNISHGLWLNQLAERYKFDRHIAADTTAVKFPLISNQRLRSQLNFSPDTLQEVFSALDA